MKGKIRVGIIGAGFGRRVHLPAFQNDSRCEVTALFTDHEEKRDAFKKQLPHLRIFSDWQALVHDNDIDLISVAVPPRAQPEILKAALAKRKPIFCEKPLAASLEQANEVIELARKTRIPAMIDFEIAENDKWRTAKKILEEGGIGRLRHVSVNWTPVEVRNAEHSWKMDRDQGGGVLHSFVSHSFYYLEWFLGRMKKISGKFFHPENNPQNDTLAHFCLETQQGVPVVLSVSTHAPFGKGHRLEFYGDEGAIFLENSTKDHVRGFSLKHGHKEDGLREILSGPEHFTGRSDEDGRIFAVSQLTKKLVDWILNGKPEKPSLMEGWRVQYLIDRALESAECDSWVSCTSKMIIPYAN